MVDGWVLGGGWVSGKKRTGDPMCFFSYLGEKQVESPKNRLLFLLRIYIRRCSFKDPIYREDLENFCRVSSICPKSLLSDFRP